MKKVVVCLILLSAVLVSGSEIIMPSINGDFAENGRFWVPITSGNGKVNFSGGIMELSRNDGASYADAGNSRQNVSFLPGDKIKLTFSAKGEGWVSAGFRMSSSGNVTKRFKLTSEFSRCNFTVDTAKLKLPEGGLLLFHQGTRCPLRQPCRTAQRYHHYALDLCGKTRRKIRRSLEQRHGNYIHFPGYFDAPVFNPRSRSFMKPVLNDPNCVGVGFAQWSGLNNYKPHFEKFLVMVNEMSAK